MSTYATSRIDRFAQLVDLSSPPVFLDGGDPRMRPAVTLTAALRHAGAVATPTPLSDSARLAMRQRLVAAATAAPATDAMPGIAARVIDAPENGERRAATAGRKISRRITTLVGSVVLVTSVAGVGVATARALPGSPFYDLKRATEAIQLWTTSGETAKGKLHLEFARTRMTEAAKLPAGSPYLASTLQAMDSQTRQGNSDLIAAYHHTGDITPLADLVTFARAQASNLTKLGPSLPTTLHQDTTYAATLLTGISQEVRSVAIGVCHACATGQVQPGGLGPILAPSVTPSTHPSGTQSTVPTSTGPTSPSSEPSAAASSHPGQVLPTLPPLLHHKKGIPLPNLSPLPLLTSLAQLLGGS